MIYCYIVDNTMQTASITSKWQVHIPVEIRKKAKLERPVQVEISVEKGRIILKPKQSKILKLAGKYKGRKPTRRIDLTRVRDFIDYSKW